MCSRMINSALLQEELGLGRSRDEELGELLVIRWGAECIGGLSWWVAVGLEERLIRDGLEYGHHLAWEWKRNKCRLQVRAEYTVG